MVRLQRLDFSKEFVSSSGIPTSLEGLQIGGTMSFLRVTNLFHFAWGFVGFSKERPEDWEVVHSWANQLTWSHSSLLAKRGMC